MKKYFPSDIINLADFKKFCINSKMSDEDVLKVYAYLDLNQDGKISKQEFSYRLIILN